MRTKSRGTSPSGKKIERRKNNSVQHLYTKGNIFYFRYAFPKHFQNHYGRKEIRCSLKTAYKHTAHTLATIFYAHIQIFMREDKMRDYAELKKQLTEKFNALIAINTQSKLSFRDIKLRINGYTQAVLDADASNYHKRIGVVCHTPQGVTETLGTADYAKCIRAMLHSQVNNPECLEELAPIIIIKLLREGVFTPEEISATNVKQIANEYLKQQVTIKKIIVAREHGDYLAEADVFKLESTPVAGKYEPEQSPEPPAIPPKDTGVSLSELIQKFVDAKRSDGAWQEHSVKDHINRLKTCLNILGDRQIGEIRRDDMRFYRETLRQLPPNLKKLKKYKNMTIDEIVASKPQATLSVKTVNVTVEAVSGMFEWAVREGILDKNPSSGLTIKDDRKAINLREIFTPKDLKQIFESTEFIAQKRQHPELFWIPLIALYTGMRLEEVAQIYCEDVYPTQSSQTWVFDVNNKSKGGQPTDKKVKTKSAIRLIPIHNDLKFLGFIDYLEKIIGSESLRLFPNLKLTASSQKYGKEIGKKFSRLLKRCGVGGQKSFHSLRHTFSDHLKNKNKHNQEFTQIFGHEASSLAARQYGAEFTPEKCLDNVIKYLSYNLDLQLIKES